MLLRMERVLQVVIFLAQEEHAMGNDCHFKLKFSSRINGLPLHIN